VVHTRRGDVDEKRCSIKVVDVGEMMAWEEILVQRFDYARIEML